MPDKLPTRFNILIFNENTSTKNDIKEILFNDGYFNVFSATSFEQAIHKITIIDLVIIENGLNNIKDCNDLILSISQNFSIPFIYIFFHSDSNSINNLRQTKAKAFILKPYHNAQLLATLQLILLNHLLMINAYRIENNKKDNGLLINNHLIIKENYRVVKIPFNEILWFEADKNHVQIKTIVKKHILRTSLKKIQYSLPLQIFIKTNRKFIINMQHIDSFDGKYIEIETQQISISRNEKKEVLKRLKMQNIYK